MAGRAVTAAGAAPEFSGDRVCTFDWCEEPARARVTRDEVKVGWTERKSITMRVRPLSDPDAQGREYCLQHTHFWVDWALMSSLAEPS